MLFLNLAVNFTDCFIADNALTGAQLVGPMNCQNSCQQSGEDCWAFVYNFQSESCTTHSSYDPSVRGAGEAFGPKYCGECHIIINAEITPENLQFFL